MKKLSKRELVWGLSAVGGAVIGTAAAMSMLPAGAHTSTTSSGSTYTVAEKLDLKGLAFAAAAVAVGTVGAAVNASDRAPMAGLALGAALGVGIIGASRIVSAGADRFLGKPMTFVLTTVAAT